VVAVVEKNGGGGGAGGYRESYSLQLSGCYCASPLATATSLPVSVQAYPVTVGGGGFWSFLCNRSMNLANRGSNSVFSTITSAGGGGGGGQTPACIKSWCSWWIWRWWTWRFVPGSPRGGTGNTPPVSPPQGNNGGNGNPGSAM
jgi:hypothetical protein